MDRSSWLEAARRAAGELPEGARVVLVQTVEPRQGDGLSPEAERRAAFELAAALGAVRRRVLLLDLVPANDPGPDRPDRRAAPGLWEVLRGEATVAEVAERNPRRGFIYVPAGPRPRRPPRPEGAEVRRLRLLLQRARGGDATTLLRGPGAAGPLRDLADGVVRIEPRPAAGSPSPVAGRAGPDRPRRTVGTADDLPVLARFLVPPPRRRLVASGRYGPDAPAETPGPEAGGASAPRRADGRSVAGSRTPRPRPGRARRPGRGRRPPPGRRHLPAARRARSARSTARPAPLGPVALLACLALLGFGLATLVAPEEAPEAGAADRALERARLLELPPRTADEPPGEAMGSLEPGLPDPLPFSTFSIGTALWADSAAGPGREERAERSRAGGGRR